MRLKRKKPNIIFIVIDALRPRNLGCYGYAKSISQWIINTESNGKKSDAQRKKQSAETAAENLVQSRLVQNS
jgi:arylsulfatase A-like enzyme